MQKQEADIGACEEAADMGVRRGIGVNVLQVPTNTTLVLFGKNQRSLTCSSLTIALLRQYPATHEQ